jgi:hypothetical protein
MRLSGIGGHRVAACLASGLRIHRSRSVSRSPTPRRLIDGQVNWYFESVAAARAIRSLAGVCGVTNLIEVVQPATPDPDVVKRLIQGALTRHVELDAKKIQVAASVERRSRSRARCDRGPSATTQRRSRGAQPACS